MTSDQKKTQGILIVDSDEACLSRYKGEVPESGAVKPLPSASAAEAKELLLKHEGGIVATFVAANVPELGWLEVIEASHRHRPGVPIFLVQDPGASVPEFSAEELKAMGLRESLGKPLEFKRMVELVASMAAGFDKGAALEIAKQNKDELGKASAATDDAFVPIRAENFLSGTLTIFDLYIRLGKDHFLKILQAGDSFEAQRLEKYLSRGVVCFHLRREAQETYLRFCEHLTTRILKSKKVPVHFKVAQTLNQGQEVANFFKHNELKEEEIQYANSFVANVQELFNQFQPRKVEVLNAFMKDLMAYDHGVATAMIASLLARELQVVSSYARQVVGVAALLHDVGFQKVAPELRDEDEESMSKEQLWRYYTHPDVGADLLQKIRSVDPAVSHAVAAHHVRRDGSGFPKHAGATRMNQVAEIVGISDEFLRLIAKAKRVPEAKIVPLRSMEQEVFKGFSRQVADAFRKLFMRKPGEPGVLTTPG